MSASESNWSGRQWKQYLNTECTSTEHLLLLCFCSLLIKSNQEKFYVSVEIQNSGDNAYNTKVTLSHTENINYVKVEVGYRRLNSLTWDEWHHRIQKNAWLNVYEIFLAPYVSLLSFFIFCSLRRRIVSLIIPEQFVQLDILSSKLTKRWDLPPSWRNAFCCSD